MFRKFNKIKYLQKGASIVTAIFLLVVLAGLGAMMVSFFVVQQQSSALDVTGSRAYRAARAGIEWGAYNINVLTPPNTLWAGCAAIPAPLFAAGALAADLAPFTVNLVCNPPVSAVEAGSTIWIYNLTSTASAGGAPGGADYVERQVTVRIRGL